MNDEFDVLIIGAGLMGCFTARSLMRRRLSVAILERNPDVCMEMSRANTAIVYAGYDTKPGTLKTELCLRANKHFAQLCEELDVDFVRCGSLMTAEGEKSEEKLRKKFSQGLENGLANLKLLSREEALALEPSLSPAVTMALYSPDTGTVNPWALCVAAAENAVENGAQLYLNHAVTAIRKTEDCFLVEAAAGSFRPKPSSTARGFPSTGSVSWQPGLFPHPPHARGIPRAGPRTEGQIRHIVFQETEEKHKGLTLVPTTDGSLLLGASETERAPEGEPDFATTPDGLQALRERAAAFIPSHPLSMVIRSFGSLRPNPFWLETDSEGNPRVSDKKISSFVIGSPEDVPGLFNLVGIKTPGLTCSDEIGSHVAGLVLSYLGGAEENPAFRPNVTKRIRFRTLTVPEQQELARRNPAYGRIVCRCNQITEAEVVEAVHRTGGATTVDGVKRRAGTGLGRCQGGFCTERILELLGRELHVPPSEVRKDKPGSYLIK
jgi:glycerol-3-phosphate dehydrogenase